MTFPAHYRTSTVVALAEQIRGGRWELAKYLADALEDAGADGASLAPLRDPGIASSLSGLWLAGIAGRDGLWEWGQGWEELAESPNCVLLRTGVGTRCSERIGVLCRSCQLRSRRAELQRLHTGPCPMCGDLRNVWLGEGRARGDCPTCVLAVRERWDECRCPCCPPEGKRHVICAACRNSGDLLLRPERIEVGTELQDDYRPLSFDSGPLPTVTVRLEELVREEECLTPTDPRKGIVTRDWAGYLTYDRVRSHSDCGRCSGTGVVHVPGPWLRALPAEYDVMLAMPEPGNIMGSGRWGWARYDLPAFLEKDRPEGSSPAAAHAALRQGLRRWRFSC